jgi:hypothetical protein
VGLDQLMIKIKEGKDHHQEDPNRVCRTEGDRNCHEKDLLEVIHQDFPVELFISKSDIEETKLSDVRFLIQLRFPLV